MEIKKTMPTVDVEIPISTEFIKLEAFLKFSGAVETGGEAKKSDSKWRCIGRRRGLYYPR